MKLIALCGFAGSGKDTVAEYLEVSHGYRSVSFADTLKDCLAVMLGWDRQALEGRTPEDRRWRETVDPWWAERLGVPHFTPRFAMTHLGTEVMRKHFHDSIWILSVERKLALATTPMVITDLRYPNEFTMARKNGAVIGRVRRGIDPVWLPVGIKAAAGCRDAVEEMIRLDIHSSEWAWLLESTDIDLDNNQDIPHLHRQAALLP